MTEQEKTYKQLFDSGYQCGIEDAQPKWISVKDRLPEEGQYVLIYSNYVSGYGIRISQYFHNRFSMGNTDTTHWMPLPEPPKGE